MSYDRNDLHQFVDALESTPDVEKARAFIRMNPDARSAYLHHLSSYSHSDAISLRRRATILNVSRKLAQVDRELRQSNR